MKDFKMNFSEISKLINFDKNKIPIKGNKDKMVHVAFDLFRSRDNPEELWQVQSSDDGDFLVRTYLLPEEKECKGSNWSVEEDKKCANLTVSYKNIPIKRIETKKYNVKTANDSFLLKRTILKKLASDKKFVITFVKDLPCEKINILKQAGLLKDLSDWLKSKDITDKLTDTILKAVEDKVKNNGEDFEELEDFEWAEKWSALESHLEKKANK